MHTFKKTAKSSLAVVLCLLMVFSTMFVGTISAVAATGDASGYAVVGTMNGWDNTKNPLLMINSTDGSTTMQLSNGTYEFKIRSSNSWYGNNGTIVDTTTATSTIGWEMTTGAGNCKLQATGGYYTFIFNTNTKFLVINYSTVAPTEATTEAPTTEAPTEEVTEAPTEEVTEAPTTPVETTETEPVPT
ncbi:MAG: hypothetical protein ACI4HO_10535, partial [Ruminococcus sp.]